MVGRGCSRSRPDFSATFITIAFDDSSPWWIGGFIERRAHHLIAGPRDPASDVLFP